jgi:hypothetical protein
MPAPRRTPAGVIAARRRPTATSSRLLEKPVIRDRVASFLVDRRYANVDVEGELRSALPPRVQPLAGPAAGALRNFADKGTREVLARPRAQLAWEAANRARGAELAPGAAIAAVLVEHTWARALEDAVAQSGGTPASSGFVDAAALSELMPQLVAATRASGD